MLINYQKDSKAGYTRNPKYEKTTGIKNPVDLNLMPIYRPVKNFLVFCDRVLSNNVLMYLLDTDIIITQGSQSLSYSLFREKCLLDNTAGICYWNSE